MCSCPTPCCNGYPASWTWSRAGAGLLAPGGWLAFQLPGNFDQPTHAILLDLVRSDRWAPLLRGVPLNRQAGSPADYLDLLARQGCSVDAWETTYLHVLPGPDPVVEWYRGTGLRPVLAVLDPDQAERFVAEYSERVTQAYPAAPYGTVLPFRRVFVVPHRPGASRAGRAASSPPSPRCPASGPAGTARSRPG